MGDDARADAGADDRDDRVLDAASGAEPHLGPAHGLGAVVDVQGQRGAGAQQPLQGEGVPAGGRYADADAEDVPLGDPGFLDDGVETGQDVADDGFGVALAGG
ncbi:hypothetical protein SANT12839_079830 [Streptomyces antimycoticus]|uniref:Uncharacterized protein n=1 Tax=Streptomyces antimycoticus TaxID=68175 RepID=A0A4D4KD50_9ACTN|nr:hypothetical protein SANT12839_079830 [Streptomyces antimycoticus]